MTFAVHCTRCEGLATPGELFDCPRCDHVMPVDHGVLWTAPGQPPPLGDLAREAIERGWLAAAQARLEAARLGPRELMTRLNGIRTERLGDWQFLVEPDTSGTALVLNDPWGAHMTATARFMREVVVFSQDAGAAQFLRVRAAQEGLSNVSVIVCGRGTADFPFTRGQFDVVALVGPWRGGGAGATGEGLDGLARTLFRLLRRGGALLFGFPNRFGLPLGRPADPGGRPRRALRATAAASRTRLARAGFQDLQLYLPFPDLSDYSAILSLDSRIALRYFHVTYRHPRARWKRVLMGAAIDSGLLPMVAPSYIATARKP
jgi:SAM-dependent methyltransferase